MPYILGITGNIATGKSTAADFFKERGVPVWSADFAVHDLYENDKDLIKSFRSFMPKAVIADKIDRTKLRQELINNPNILQKLEAIVHPKTATHRDSFLKIHKNAMMVIFDIPLLYEKNLAYLVDGVLVMAIDKETQKKRALKRKTLNENQLDVIMKNQMPLKEKTSMADFVIESLSLDHVNNEIEKLYNRIKKQSHDNARNRS